MFESLETQKQKQKKNRGHLKAYSRTYSREGVSYGKVYRKKRLQMSTPYCGQQRNTVPNDLNTVDICQFSDVHTSGDVHVLTKTRRPTPRELIQAALTATQPPTRPTTQPPPAASFADDPRLTELLALLHLGRLSPRVGARVAQLVRENPPDALDRLERAAVHLRLTGEHADHLLEIALAYGYTPAMDYTAEQETAA